MAAEEKNTEQKFEELGQDSSIVREFWEFVCENKKFWLIPIIVVLLLLGLLILLGETAAAPFVYTLF